MIATYYLLGSRGDRFDLCEADSPIRLVDDPEGLEGAPHDPAYQELVNQGGSSYKGQQDKSNDVKLRLRVGGHDYAGDDQALHGEINRWRRNLGTGRELSEFHVQQEYTVVDEHDVETTIVVDRWQWVRYNGRDAGIPRARIANFGFSGVFDLTLTSDGSYWESEAIEVDALTDTEVRNGGWFAAWPQWQITGPTTDLAIGVDGEKVELADLTSGQTYTIDTNPTCPRIHRDGTDAWAAAAGRQSFRKPALPDVDTPITVTGTANAVTMVLPQQHWTAFG